MAVRASAARWALLGVIVSAGVQARVAELAPTHLEPYLKSHPNAVVQFTSPDRKCGYCAGSMRSFDQLEARLGGEFSFARILWLDWRKFPRAALDAGVHSIPVLVMYRDGKEVDRITGQMGDLSAAAERIKAVYAAAAAPAQEAPTARLPAAQVPPPAHPAMPAMPPMPPMPPMPMRAGASLPALDTTPLASCDQPHIVNRGYLPWRINGADAHFCSQTVVGAPFPETYTEAVAAFRDGVLVGLRDYRDPPVLKAPDNAALAGGAWAEQAHTAEPGELWWGRTGDGRSAAHYAVGQETHTRFAAALRAAAMSGNPAALQQLMAFQQGQLLPPFPARGEVRYSQIGATVMTSRNYLGGYKGAGPVANGQVSAGELRVSPQNPLTGSLSFTATVEGYQRPVTLPLKRNIFEPAARGMPPTTGLYRLVAGRPSDNGTVDCVDERVAGARAMCRFPDQAGEGGETRRERYDATVYFFGPKSDYAVVAYTLSLWYTGPAGPRHGGESIGLIVLKAE